MKKNKKKKVLLLLPKVGFDPSKPRMPTSLLVLAQYLKKKYNPVIVDTRIESDYHQKIRKHLKDSICVGITTMTGLQIKYGLELAKFVRKVDPNIPIVWGGVHPTLMPNQTIKNEYVDIIVRGEGEKTLLELVEALDKRRDLKKIDGLTFIKNNKIISTEDRKFLDQEKLKLPAWELIDVNKYQQLEIQTARGCPHRCKFCYNREFNKRTWRSKSSKKVLNELKYLIDEYNPKAVYFIDDNFFTNIKRVREICEGIIKNDWSIKWRTSCRADDLARFDEDFVKLIANAGCSELFVGAESGSQRVLNLIDKDTKVHELLTGIKKCVRYGIEPQITFILGFPSETKRDREETFSLIDELFKNFGEKILVNGFYVYTPYPGTPLFDLIVKKYNYKVPKRLEDWSTYICNLCNNSWFSKKERIYLESLSYISRFAFFNKMIEKKFVRPLLRIPFNSLVFIAKIRWKYKFFSFPYEWRIVKWILTKKKRDKSGDYKRDSQN
jgi:radical SAM superfamily enzyme YgiQ (UPF0313 family)